MKKILAATMIAGAVAATAATAGQTAFHLSNRLSGGYDDNIYLRASDKTDSFRLMELATAGIFTLCVSFRKN